MRLQHALHRSCAFSRSREQIEVANVKAANLYKSVQAAPFANAESTFVDSPCQATSPYDAVERDLKMQNKPRTQ